MPFMNYLILIGVLMIIAIIIFLIFKNDEPIILIGVTLGVITLLSLIATILEKFFPNNKVSKKLDKISKWIKDNVHF